MSKKNKKRKHVPLPVKRDPLQPPSTASESGFRVLNRVASVICYMDNQIKPMAVCTKCPNHERDRCKWGADKFRIKIVSPNEPMRFNRMAFSVGSEGIRDESRNYYFLTDIMQPTKCITDCPEYSELKDKLLAGDLWEMKEEQERKAILGSVILTLERTDNAQEAVFFDNGMAYKETLPSDVTGIPLLVKFYLYDMYSLGGLADIQLDGRFYKVKRSPVLGINESLVMVQCGENILIGKRRVDQ